MPVPRIAVRVASLSAQLPLVPSQAEWLVAGRVPVVMDSTRARTALGWKPRYSTQETLAALVAA